MRTCLTKKDLDCIGREIKNFIKQGLIDKCIKDWCPLECDSVEYDVTLSTLEYPSRAYFYSNLSKTTSTRYEDFKREFFFVNVFYSSLEYTFISETRKTSLFDLIAQVGGSLSILISLSLLYVD
jgi:hypothetical protein